MENSHSIQSIDSKEGESLGAHLINNSQNPETCKLRDSIGGMNVSYEQSFSAVDGSPFDQNYESQIPNSTKPVEDFSK